MIFLFGYKLVLLVVGGAVGAAIALHRRKIAREEGSLARDVEALGRAGEGGQPATALQVVTSALVEPRATGLPCVACGGTAMKVEHHTAEDFDGERLRVVRVVCDDCGAVRPVYVKIVALA